MPATRHVTRTRRAAIYLRDGCACVYCGRKVKLGGLTRGRNRALSATLDHCMRADDHSTLVTACYECNEALGEPPHPPPDLAQRLAMPLDYRAARQLAAEVWGPPRPPAAAQTRGRTGHRGNVRPEARLSHAAEPPG